MDKKIEEQDLRKKDSIAQILGFKISSLLQSFQVLDTKKDPKEVVPVSLLLLIALFIKYDIIDVEDIWPYLIKQIKTPEGFINDTSDPIAKYHQLLTKNLDTKYQNLERNVLDRDMINRENRKLENDMA